MPKGRASIIGSAFILAMPAIAPPAAAQTPTTYVGPRPSEPAPPALPQLQTPVQALAQDAAEYARMNGVPLDDAMRRLRAQEESVPATDRLREEYRDRVAGISIEHQPYYRIVVLLTGSDPVPDQTIIAGGMPVPIIFRTGAKANQEQLAKAITDHQAEIRDAIPRSQGMGVDPRTGEMVLLVKGGTFDDEEAAIADAELEALTGVPVRIRTLSGDNLDSGVEGGARVEGMDPGSSRRFACTTGFTVTDGARTGMVTAAHCPDALTYLDRSGARIPLTFAGEWGARFQDVQLHLSEEAQRPTFYSDTAKSMLRTVTTWRNRASTRAGDAVCHRGETSGYSCSQVELVDFAPPSPLCGGQCDPVWVTVTGPSCKGGDSGGPIFNGGVAFGIVKGGSYTSSGACNFYYYMSTDFLPAGWTLLHG